MGVQVSSDLGPRKQCIEARNQDNRLLGFIAISVISRSAEVILKLYLALIRPHLDYTVQFWSSYYRMDIVLLESVQRRMTKMIDGIYSFSYGRTLKFLKLHLLERHRVGGDLIEVFCFPSHRVINNYLRYFFVILSHVLFLIYFCIVLYTFIVKKNIWVTCITT